LLLSQAYEEARSDETPVRASEAWASATPIGVETAARLKAELAARQIGAMPGDLGDVKAGPRILVYPALFVACEDDAVFTVIDTPVELDYRTDANCGATWPAMPVP
jgi:hypothetical protein